MARPRKSMSVSTGKISKLEVEQRLKAEKATKVGRDQLTAPDWLDKRGKDEFLRVVDEAGQINLLDNLDLGVLAIYANAYSSYVDISVQIQKAGFLEERENRTENYYTVHPLIKAQDNYVKQIMSCSSKLGLATTDRLKLIVPVEEEDSTNKFLRYLNG